MDEWACQKRCRFFPHSLSKEQSVFSEAGIERSRERKKEHRLEKRRTLKDVVEAHCHDKIEVQGPKKVTYCTVKGFSEKPKVRRKPPISSAFFRIVVQYVWQHNG